jgi:hypothetical protein
VVIDSEHEFDDDASLEVPEDEDAVNQPLDAEPKTFGEIVQSLWTKRQHDLTHDYSVAGWMLSP